MKFTRSLMMGACTLVLGISFTAQVQAQDTPKWKLSTLSFDKNNNLTFKQVFNGFGCKGENLSPQLSWTRPPSGTKSLAITMYDPDAPTGSGWWHWVAFNIPADTTRLEEGASTTDKMPKGTIESVTDFGSKGFGGACPPEGHGNHHYHITLWALDVEKLELDAQASGAKVGYFLNQHKVSKAEIVGIYKR
jgi:Raf kinase inhibitor-like YbhB/YbcL family protein